MWNMESFCFVRPIETLDSLFINSPSFSFSIGAGRTITHFMKKSQSNPRQTQSQWPGNWHTPRTPRFDIYFLFTKCRETSTWSHSRSNTNCKLLTSRNNGLSTSNHNNLIYNSTRVAGFFSYYDCHSAIPYLPGIYIYIYRAIYILISSHASHLITKGMCVSFVNRTYYRTHIPSYNRWRKKKKMCSMARQ